MKYAIVITITIFVFSGCRVGPDYVKPKMATPASFQESRSHQEEEITDDTLAHWWTTFQDPFLDQLIQTALAQNFDYKIALDRISQARAQYRYQYAQILPEIDATASGSRSRLSRSFKSSTPATSTTTTTSTSGVPPITTTSTTTTSTPQTSRYSNLFQANIDLLWEIDLFGKMSRLADSSFDLWQATVHEMRGIKIQMISEIISTYTLICSLQKQKEIAKDTIELNREILFLALDRFESGLADEQEVEAQIAGEEIAIASYAQVEAAYKSAIYSMATLLGKLPEELLIDYNIERTIPQSSRKVPGSLPSTLLRRRPDIQSAERQFASATEQIGAAIADYFPTLALIGSSTSVATNPLGGTNIGFSSDAINKLFKHSSRIWGFGALSTVPILDFGRRQANVDIQRALCNQAYHNYQKTVLAAFQETEQVLATYFNNETRRTCFERELEANRKSLQLATDLFKAGLTDYAEVLSAMNIYLISLQSFTVSEQVLTTDLVNIYKALGGDWQ